MTEKRFNLVDLLETLAIADGDECKYYQNCNDDFMSLCKELNVLHEEKEALELDNKLLLGEMKEIRDKLTIYLKVKELE